MLAMRMNPIGCSGCVVLLGLNDHLTIPDEG